MDKQERVIEINDKVKDTFFKTVYQSEDRRKSLAAFLLGVDVEHATIRNVKPVIFGNKENDLAFLCDDAIYCMMEEQSSICVNMPYRILEYITAALRSTIETEQALYGKTRVLFPVPRLYVTFVGLEEKVVKIPDAIQYDMKLSDAYRTVGQFVKDGVQSDLEVTVHVYDFRMTYEEAFDYIENETIPLRMSDYNTELRDYAFFCNALRYVQRAQTKDVYPKAQKAKDENELFTLLMERGIFVDLLSDKEVCDMTVAQFSREDIIKSQGREEGLEEGREEGREEEREEGLCSMVKTIKSLVGDDFVRVSELIRNNDNYSQVSDEEIRKYWE